MEVGLHGEGRPPPSRYGQKAIGMHPTVIHSCNKINLQNI